MKNFARVILLALVAFIAMTTAATPVDEAECEVCVGVLSKFQQVANEKKITSVDDLEEMYRKECSAMTNSRDKRLCWYLGASKDSATNVLREVSRPMTMSLPPLAICRKIRRFDSAICSMRYVGGSVQDPEPVKENKKPKAKPTPKPKVIDYSKLSKMRVKELKEILANWGEKCSGCAEKDDFISKINSLRPKYDTKTEL